MKDEDLKDLINGILQQTEETSKSVKNTEAKLQNIENIIYKSKMEEIKPTSFSLPENETEEFFQKFNYGIATFSNLVNNLPTEIKSTVINENNLVLFSKKYNEGNYGAKELLKGVYMFLGICFFMFLLFKYVPSYLAVKDENLAFKNTVQWFYFRTDKKGKSDIVTILNHFKNQDTLYLNELNRFKQTDQKRTYE